MNKTSLILGLSLLSLSACFNVTLNGQSGKTAPGKITPAPADAGEETETTENPSGEAKGDGRVAGDAPQSTTPTTVGVKNAEQIMRSMAIVSGIDPFQTGTFGRNANNTANTVSLTPNNQNQSIYTAFDLEYKGVMPASNSIGAFNSNAQIAVVKLAWAFCDALGGRTGESEVPANVTAARVAMFGDGHAIFLAGNASSISDMKTQVVMPLIDKFWTDGSVSDQQVASSYAEMVTLGNKIAASKIVPTVGAQRDPLVRDVVRAVCAATLSASPTVLY